MVRREEEDTAGGTEAALNSIRKQSEGGRSLNSLSPFDSVQDPSSGNSATHSGWVFPPLLT